MFTTFRTISRLLICGCIAGFAACGPDDSGNDRILQFSGVVVGTDGLPVSEAVVTVFETGESSSTDENGEFLVDSFRHPSSAGLFFELSAFTNIVTINSIPKDAALVRVTVSVDRNTLTATLIDVTFDSDGGGQPVPPSPVPGTTPTAPPNGTPGTPAPTPTSRPGSFDGSGNTTRFGIPNGLTGNISRGRSVWGGTCLSCHAREKTNKSYGDIKRALQTIPEMRAVRVSNQQVADVTAYLNRGRP